MKARKLLKRNPEIKVGDNVLCIRGSENGRIVAGKIYKVYYIITDSLGSRLPKDEWMFSVIDGNPNDGWYINRFKKYEGPIN